MPKKACSYSQSSRLKTYEAIIIKLHYSGVWINVKQTNFFIYQTLYNGYFTDTQNPAGTSNATAINGHFNNVFFDTPVTGPAIILEHERFHFTEFILTESAAPLYVFCHVGQRKVDCNQDILLQKHTS